ncbi:MAG: hypothetical protein ACI87O_001154 [Planctomycetota bacterium]
MVEATREDRMAAGPSHGGGALFHDLLTADERHCRCPEPDHTHDAGENVLMRRRPSMARGNPCLFVLLCTLAPVFGLGLLGLAYWSAANHFTVLTVTEERILLRRGIFSKQTDEIPNGALHHTHVHQSLVDRLLGVGRLSLSSAGQDGYELDVARMRKPYDIKSLIDRVSREGRWGRVGATEHG